MSLNAAVLGASGFVGGELVRLLLGHPHFKLMHIFSTQFEGKRLWEVDPSFTGFSSLSYERFETTRDWSSIDVLFLSTPHREAARLVGQIDHFKGVLIDMTGDHRLKDPAQYSLAYDMDHPHPENLPKFTYGLVEGFRESLSSSRFVANPGCFATAALLAAKPLVETQALSGRIVATAITGSSGSGKTLGEGTHHPLRHDNIVAYKLLTHQHEPEIAQALKAWSPGGIPVSHRLITQSGPFTRGIYLISHAELLSPGIDAHQLFKNAYENEAFIRLREKPVHLKHVIGTNFCDLHVAQSGREVVVTAAIDNLVKGAAGQAIQTANLIFKRPEREGLWTSALVP